MVRLTNGAFRTSLTVTFNPTTKTTSAIEIELVLNKIEKQKITKLKRKRKKKPFGRLGEGLVLSVTAFPIDLFFTARAHPRYLGVRPELSPNFLLQLFIFSYCF